MRADPGGVFKSDAHRRVLGNLAQPRSLEDLTNFLYTIDWANLPDFSGQDDVKAVLEDLVDSGYAKNIGKADDGADLVKMVNGDKTVIDLHKDKAKTLSERADHWRFRTRYSESDQYVLTKEGLEKLQESVPNEPPPLEGPRLEAAQQQDEELRKHEEAIEKARKEDK